MPRPQSHNRTHQEGAATSILGRALPVPQRHAAGLLLLAALGGLAYWNSLSNQFVHDDNYQIVRNPFLHSDEPLSRLLFTDVWGYQSPGRGGVSNYYRPLQMITYRWTAQWAGLDPQVFHIVNLALHLVSTALGYFLMWQMSRLYLTSLSAAILFVLHPIHTEAVDWIASLPELGCALFYFLSFWLFLLWRGEPGPEILPKKGRRPAKLVATTPPPRLLWLLGSLLAFAVSLLWKEMALTMPFLVVAWIILFPGEDRRWQPRLKSMVMACWPYLLVVAAYLVLRYRVLGFISKSQQVWSLTPVEFGLSLVYLVAEYWHKLALPVHLNAFYTFRPVHSFLELRALVSLSFVAAAAGLILNGRQRAPLASFSASWVFLTLLPVLNIRGVGINVFTERYLYIPSLGFCLLAAWLAGKGLSRLALPRRRWAGAAVLAVVSALYGFQTLRRNADWANDFIFYNRAAEASPNSSSMHNSLSHILRAEKGDLEGAERHALLALEMAKDAYPPDPRLAASAYLNLSNIYIQRQQYAKALELAEKGLAVEGSQPNLRVAHGVALMQLDRLDEARKVFQEVNQLLPNDELVLHYLGVIALRNRQFEQAILYFRKALKVLPSYADAHNNLAATYVEMGRLNEALPHLQEAATLNPRDPMAQTNVAIVLAGLGRTVEARSHLERALALSPNFPPAVSELAALQRQRQ